MERILREERALARAIIEDEVRDAFQEIIHGEGPFVLRITVKRVIDKLFPPAESGNTE